MSGKSFGKRPAVPEQATAGADAPQRAPQQQTQDGPQFPWSADPASTACNFAFGHLARNLAAPLAANGRVHAETYMAGAGAVAGFAAQQTLFDGSAPVVGVNIHLVETRSGGKYWFGDPLNFMLVPNGTRDDEKLWPLAAGAATAAGLLPSHAIRVDDMFKHVAATIGGTQEGLPSTPPDHQPQAPALLLLQLMWPLAEACLTGTISAAIPDNLKLAPKRWWACITANAAARAIVAVKDVLPPGIALTIMMESAIYASKVSAEEARKRPEKPA